MTFLEHLEVMRWHLLRSIAAIVILALVAFVFKDIVFDKIILTPKEPEFPTNRWLCQLGDILGLKRLCINSNPFTLQTVKMAEQFSMHIIVSLVAGIVVAFPYIFWEFWRFIVPALYEKEKKTAAGAVFSRSDAHRKLTCGPRKWKPAGPSDSVSGSRWGTVRCGSRRD